MIFSALARVVALLAGMIVQREILIAYGSALNGLTSSISQVMSYLVLFEAGLGTASIQALYEPLANNNWGKISGIISATGSEYKRITIFFTVALCLVSAILPIAILDEITYSLASLLTLVTGASYVVSYIIGGKYKALINADRKVYILYILDIITLSLSCVFRVIALKSGASILFAQFINLITIGLKNIGYTFYVHKKYSKIDYSAKPDKLAISKRWSVLIHNIAGLVVNHTDVMILTVFGTLKLVSIYSVYNMVFSQMSTTIQSAFLQAPQATFGRMFNGNKSKFKEFYDIYDCAFQFLLFAVVCISIIMILPFVNVYTNGVTDAEYINTVFPLLFAAILLLSQIRSPSVILINVAGTFKETQKGAIIEAIINLCVSLILFFFTDLGITGLLIGTVCSYLFRTIDVITYSYKNILKTNATVFIRTFFTNLISSVLICYIFYYFRPVMTNSILEWILTSIWISMLTFLFLLLANLILNRKMFVSTFTFMKSNLRKAGRYD